MFQFFLVSILSAQNSTNAKIRDTHAMISIFLKKFIIPVLKTIRPIIIKGKDPKTMSKSNFLSLKILNNSLLKYKIIASKEPRCRPTSKDRIES